MEPHNNQETSTGAQGVSSPSGVPPSQVPPVQPAVPQPAIVQPSAAPPSPSEPPTVQPVVQPTTPTPAVQPAAAPQPAAAAPAAPAPSTPAPGVPVPAQPAALPASPYAAPAGMVVGGEPAVPGTTTSTDWVIDPSQGAAGGAGSNTWLKPLLIGGGSLALLVIAVCGFYFGYYTNSSVLFSQALKNTGKGYDKMVTYAEEQSKNADQLKGVQGSGDYKLSYSDKSYRGDVAVASYEKNSSFKASLKLDDKTYTLETMTIDSKKQHPDFYFKVGGITGLGDSFGSPEISATLNALDNTWISVDEKYFDELEQEVAKSESKDKVKDPTDDQVFDAMRAVGKVNDEYLFSTKADKRLYEIKDKKGIETVEGHKAHHYVIGINTNNLKDYIAAQKSAVSKSKLSAWIKQGDNQAKFDQTFKDFNEEAKQIKSTDTFDFWADLKTRMLYKARIAEDDAKDKANNYGEFGLDYKGGKSYPFFFAGKSKDQSSASDGRVDLILNSIENSLTAKANIRSTGSNDGDFKGNFTAKPNEKKLDLKAPANVKMLSQVLNDFGFGDTGASSAGGFSTTKTPKKSNPGLAYFMSELDKYKQKSGAYPSLAQLNTPGWRLKNTPNLQQYYSVGNAAGTAGLTATSGLDDLKSIKGAFVDTPLETLPFWH